MRVATGTGETSARPEIVDRNARLLAFAVIALVVAGVVLRVWVLASPLGRPDSDEAVTGLMANAFRHGHITTYYWGQSYGGTIEPALVAVVFALTGSSALGLKIVPIALSAVACVLVWRVGRRTVGDSAARFAAALFWVYPPAFLWGSTKERDFYQAGLVLALTVLLLAIRLERSATTTGRLPRPDLIAFGFAAGLAVWTTPQSLYVLAPVVLWLGVRARACWRQAWPILPAGIVGGFLWLLYAARHGRSAFYQTNTGVSYPDRVKNFFTDMLPRAFGGKLPEAFGYFGGSVGRLLFWPLLVIAVGAIAWKARDASRRRPLGPLLVTAIAFPFLASAPRISSITDEPRYALLLAPIAALLLAWVLVSTTARVVASVAVVVLGFAFIASMLRWVDHRPQNEDIGPPSLASAEHLLDRLGVDRVYADYWIAYRLTFDTDKRIIASPVLSARNDELATKVASAPVTPYLVYSGDVYDTRFGPALRRAGIGYRRIASGNYAVYLPNRAVAPERFQAIWLLDP